MKFWKLSLIVFSFGLIILYQTFEREQKPPIDEPRFEEGFDGPDQFIKFHHDIRTPEGASSPEYKKGFLVSELKNAEAATLAANKSNARTEGSGVIEWKERGPVNVPGRTRGLLVDPADNTGNTWYAGSVGGGVWKTTNAGSSWQLITPTLTNLATTVLAMSASNPNVIFVGTGEGFGNVDAVRGNGIFKSIDRGVTWSYLSSTSNFSDVNRIIIDPANQNLVLAATNNGIYRTTNGGTSWTQVSNRTRVQDLKATPGNFSVQFATQNGIGVLKSTDAGLTWANSNTGMIPVGRCEIAISPVKPSRIFASCENGDTPKMFMSDDAGVTWSLVNITLSNNTPLDFLGGIAANDGQGWYDNTIACDPFNQDVIYFAGINLFQAKLDAASSSSGIYTVDESATQSFMTLNSFPNATNGNFDVGTSAGTAAVEIRFGPGKSQKAHRFLVPVNATTGVSAANYTYQNYVTVPFEVWDVTNNIQLMVSFRDQGREGAFNLLNLNVDNADATLQSREYVYVNNVPYNASTPNTSIAVDGGHEFNKMYFIWPVLPQGSTWPPTINGNLKFSFSQQQKLNATTQFITDGRSEYGNPSKNSIVHVDHHNIVMIPMSATTYKILNANDGGVFVSNTSATPGINNGDWTLAGRTFNTSQFYGADKRPAFDEYFGGMQDNGTWKSPQGTIASNTTDYNFNIGGDGFEVIWNNNDDKKMIGGSQNNNFRRSIDGGISWATATSGLSGSHPFISKLANSRDNPETLFTLSSVGVFRSPDFGLSWLLTSITNKWGSATVAASFMDVEVSRANASIVWAGSGMVNIGTLRNLQVSTNGGVSFASTNNYTLTTLGNITKLASHPTQQQTAYALFSFAGKPKILRTTDLGQTWNDISGFNTSSTSNNGFPDVAVFCLYVRTDNPNIIWAGTEIGIVESIDNGQSWILLDDFPRVCVWDMKGVDDQIVVATHGRGIWTAKLNAIQQNPTLKPTIIATGTSPQSDFMVKIGLLDTYDSTQVFVNSQKIGLISKRAIGEYLLKLKNVNTSSVDLKLVGFKNSAPFHSPIFTSRKLTLKNPYQNQYSNLFKDAADFSLDKLILQGFGTSNQSLQSAHPYFSNSEATAILLQPIIVSATNSNFNYQDVALIQPSASGVTFGQPAFKDFVVVEGTKNGIDWIPLKDGYNASANANWLTAYSTNQVGSTSLSVDQSIDLKSKFKATDTLLFRFRLKADADATTGWGWSIDNLFIQQPPTGIESESLVSNLVAFPNPTSGKLKVLFTLHEPSPTTLEIFNAGGNTVLSNELETLSIGSHEKEIDLSAESNGIYFIKLKTKEGSKTIKILVKK